jgi:glycosyltransferase involved in cell wall biosynthesis
MRICFVSKEVAGVRGGGIGTYIAEAGKALTAAGHEVWLLIAHPGDDRVHLLERLPGFHRAVLVGTSVPGSERKHFFHSHSDYGHCTLVHQTLQRLGVRFDYIEFPDYEAEALTVFQEQRLFQTYGDTVLGLMLHSPTWECFAYDKQEHRADLRIREICNLEEEAIRIAPMLQSPSAGLRDHVLQRLGIARDVAIIRYPMELAKELPEPPSPRQSLAELRFLYYGRIEPRKGIDELVDAFAQLPDLRLTLIGGDVPYSPYGKSFRDYVRRRAGANVEFVDAMPRPKLLERIGQTDVCIFPSLFENWPNTCIEAMASARVVIGSKWGGMSEMIEHGVSGFLVDGRSAQDIARVIKEDLARNLDRLPAIGRAAAVRMRQLSDQQTYCDALVRRIEDFRRARKVQPAREPARHKVSVIVPFYKDRDTIDEAVDSAIAQTHKNLEILIVNDGSPLADASAILSAQEQKDPRIRVFSKPNGGLGSARNHGIERATGDYLLFLDADNRARPEYASTALAALLSCPESLFVTPHVDFFDDETGTCTGTLNPLPFDRNTGLLLNRFGDAGAFFSAAVFQQHGLRYEQVIHSYEDWALWMDLAARGLRGERVPRTLYDYRVRRNSMMAVDGAPNHPALVGLLIHRHFPDTTPQERAVLSTIFSVCGQSILRVMMGHPDYLPHTHQGKPRDPQPPQAAKSAALPVPPRQSEELRRHPLRYKVVDELSRLSRKIPGLNRALRALLGGMSWLAGAKRPPQ